MPDVTASESYPKDIKTVKEIAVATSHKLPYWRGGMRFGADFVVIKRDEVEKSNWDRIVADDLLLIRDVVTASAPAKSSKQPKPEVAKTESMENKE